MFFGFIITLKNIYCYPSSPSSTYTVRCFGGSGIATRFTNFILVLLLSLPLSAQQKGTTIVNTNNNNRSGRMALVIGNGNYEGQGKLRNPGNDADAMSKALQELGFKVWTAKNLTLRRMDSLIDVWGNRIKDYEVALFYFSGHGAEVAGENYLFPISATPSTESDVKYDCYPVNKIVGKMNSARTATNILLLNACRNNPFQRSWQRDAGGSGLANMEVPRGMFFGFSTSPGRTADDGSGNKKPEPHYCRAKKQIGFTQKITLPKSQSTRSITSGSLTAYQRLRPRHHYWQWKGIC